MRLHARVCVCALVLRRERGRAGLQRICGFATHGPFKGRHLELQALPGARAVSEEREERSQLGSRAVRRGRGHADARRTSAEAFRGSPTLRSSLGPAPPCPREPACAAVRRCACRPQNRGGVPRATASQCRRGEVAEGQKGERGKRAARHRAPTRGAPQPRRPAAAARRSTQPRPADTQCSP